MSDVLRPEEVESLLSVNAGSPRRTAAAASGRVTRYDPKHAGRLGNDRLRALRTLHEPFCASFAAALSTLLRSNVDCMLAGVERLTYGEFVFGLENPTCLHVVKAEPLETSLLLEINPSILYPIIDRLLGGGCDISPVVRRPPTEIEQRLARRVTGVFLAELRRAWENLVPLALVVVRAESNPQLVKLAPPDEPVVMIRFEFSFAGALGMMSLCIPQRAIEPIGERLPRSAPTTAQRAAPTGRKDQVSLVELVVRLANSRIAGKEIIGLGVGDIITTEKSIDSPLVVEVEGIARFHARPGAFEGRRAIRIDETLSNTASVP